jgi:hypothetical protein
MLARILAFAENVEGVTPPDDDDDVDPAVLAHEQEQRRWFSGMFIYASITVVDELFADIATLHASGNPTVDLRDTQQLSALPPQFAGQYTALFAQQLLVSTIDVTQQFVQGWVHPSTLAEELAVRLILNEVEGLAEMAPVVMDNGFREHWEETLYQDLDFEWLYTASAFGDVVGGTSVETWFEPFDNAAYPPSPYARSDSDSIPNSQEPRP